MCSAPRLGWCTSGGVSRSSTPSCPPSYFLHNGSARRRPNCSTTATPGGGTPRSAAGTPLPPGNAHAEHTVPQGGTTSSDHVVTVKTICDHERLSGVIPCRLGTVPESSRAG